MMKAESQENCAIKVLINNSLRLLGLGSGRYGLSLINSTHIYVELALP